MSTLYDVMLCFKMTWEFIRTEQFVTPVLTPLIEYTHDIQSQLSDTKSYWRECVYVYYILYSKHASL